MPRRAADRCARKLLFGNEIAKPSVSERHAPRCAMTSSMFDLTKVAATPPDGDVKLTIVATLSRNNRHIGENIVRHRGAMQYDWTPSSRRCVMSVDAVNIAGIGLAPPYARHAADECNAGTQRSLSWTRLTPCYHPAVERRRIDDRRVV
jgi:hypothetical protein